jgi:predicted acylesterase/phospholipase RssA
MTRPHMADRSRGRNEHGVDEAVEPLDFSGMSRRDTQVYAIDGSAIINEDTPKTTKVTATFRNRSGCITALVALMSTVGCAGSRSHLRDPWLAAKRTCLVLSVGGPAGVAHLGALEALKGEHVRIDCVAGNSIGALIGSMYVVAPEGDTTAYFRTFVAAYAQATKREAQGNVTIGAILGGLVLGIVTGGVGAAIVLGGALGGVAGAEGTARVDFDRMVRVLNDLYRGAVIENLGIAYTAFYQRRRNNGLVLVEVQRGNLAQGALMSGANPFIFEGFDVRRRGFVDPGADRLAMTPVEDTCRLFPDARLIAINVTGQPAKYDSKTTCPVLEVRVDLSRVRLDAVFQLGMAFDAVRGAGFDATVRALRSRPLQ